VKCTGTVANRAAIGAKIRVKALIGGITVWQLREIRGTSNGQPLIAHFGLGDATNVDTLRIEWPDGTVQELNNIHPRQILTVVEPSRLTITRSNGQPEITLKGGRFMTYEIQVSVNLKSWMPEATVTITNFNGTVPIAISIEQAESQKFYRAVLR